MTNKCPECGAELPPGELCEDRFNLCLAHEYENPVSYGQVHHLMVACYMLQHNRYSREGWLGARQIVFQSLKQGATPAELRKRNRQRVDSGHRKWSVTRGERIPGFERIAWTRTIADVRMDNPETYCADVKLWATSVLADTESLVRELDTGR